MESVEPIRTDELVSGFLPSDRTETAPPLELQDVIDSVYSSYPLLTAALLSRTIADGERLSASGAFDLKLKGGGTGAPLGYYRTYRFGAGASQPLFSGGEIFGGYKIGRGNFQPWFGERNTNDGGEFSTGVSLPLARNRRIDQRRAELMKTNWGRRAVEPDIQRQVIEFVRESTYAYWQWVAAGRNYQIARSLLDIAEQRNAALRRRAELGDIAPIDVTDNERLIVSRRSALIDARRKLQQAAVKLSLFLRTPDGEPVIPSEDRLPESFPPAEPVDPDRLDADIQIALAGRPELTLLEMQRRKLHVDLSQARNEYLPQVDAILFASKDVGGATSPKRDKTPFELEASVQVSVPFQRRKALGKIRSLEGKLSQISAKVGLTEDKIATEVQVVQAALDASFRRIVQAEQSLELARTMEQAERRKFELGQSNLLLVNLREKAAADAAKTLLQAMLDYHLAQADYRAVMALDVGPQGVTRS